MMSAFLTGFFLGLSLIVAIGAQNTFVFRQGIIGRHVFYVALFCAISDAVLICAGVVGISIFLNSYISQISNILFGLSALWLAGYGFIRLKTVFTSDTNFVIDSSKSKNLLPTLSIIAILTFANPHVYLDTVILIGSVSQQFIGESRIAFTLGASLSSFIFFFTLGYGARLLEPIMRHSYSWKILDSLIALIMFSIALKLAYAGNWI